MPDIGGSGDSGIGKTYALGYWQSEECDNSLAIFPDGYDFSWGILSLEIDGCNDDNYVEVKILNNTNDVLKSVKYTENGSKALDLSQYHSIESTQDVYIRIEIINYI